MTCGDYMSKKKTNIDFNYNGITDGFEFKLMLMRCFVRISFQNFFFRSSIHDFFAYVITCDILVCVTDFEEEKLYI